MASTRALDPLTLPLYGERLIEASAGTGKTYTLAALYLRLLLGLGQESAFARPLSVEEILVVTFTEAATKELRGRIRENIHQLRLACLRESSEEPLLSALLAQIEDKAGAAAVLLDAERLMDEAAIYTIHGFCQRMLTLNAFESGVLFEQSILTDESTLLQQVCADFWRRHCYPLSQPLAQEILREWQDPHALLQELKPYLYGDLPHFVPPPQEQSLLERHESILLTIRAVKSHWLAVSADLPMLLAESDLNKRSYSSRYLPVWLEKIQVWAESDSESYRLPAELERFSQRILCEKTAEGGQAPQHALFVDIEQLFDLSLGIRDVFLVKALQAVREQLQIEKHQRAQMGFGDLISRLDQALQKSEGMRLAEVIRQRYPVAMIDEFQDTDPQQYRIFQALYAGQPTCGLLLIGDPKQAIYAFRGADIFTYMSARRAVTEHYTLATNWRSSPGMVSAINCVFSRLENPFLFAEIPFVEVQAADKNHTLSFEWQATSQPALQFWSLECEGVGSGDYQQVMAQQCAAQIQAWLQAGQAQQAFLVKGETRRPLQAADITVLVRSGSEAQRMQDALNERGIPSVYLSNRDSVFATPEARDLFWLLQAVLSPESVSHLRTALASHLFGLSSQALENLNEDETAWDALVEEFVGYQRHWRYKGILPMLREVMTHRQITERILASQGGERRLTDLLHLGELLQESAQEQESEHALLRWLAQQIAQPDPNAENQQLRLESDRHLVQIVTIHKSKGLEYALVCLPFACGFRPQQTAFYHDRSDFTARLNVQNEEQALILAEQERLAEDMRLLYVALTRAIYHCSVGVAPLIKGNKGKASQTDMHLGALGYLLQQGQAGDATLLRQHLMRLSDNKTIVVQPITEISHARWQPQKVDEPALTVRQLSRSVTDTWRVTSYSALQRQGAGHDVLALLPSWDWEAAREETDQDTEELTPFTFPRGAAAGTFLHDILEHLDFNAAVEASLISDYLQRQGLSEEWQEPLCDWLETIRQTPFQESGPALADLTHLNRIAEMQFYLPIRRLLRADRLSQIMQQYDPLSSALPCLSFPPVEGVLTGFMDLVFCWQGRYYVLDYKSNWLGDHSECYQPSALNQAMGEHRYDLQYQLYILALHRFLRHRLPDYDYQRHIGGVYYLFLRGMNREQPGHGIFFHRPAQELVTQLDTLFEGQNIEDDSAVTAEGETGCL